MISRIRAILLGLLFLAVAGQAMAQTVTIGNVQAAPGGSVDVDLIYAGEGSGLAGVGIIVEFSDLYTDVSAGALCGAEPVTGVSITDCLYAKPFDSSDRFSVSVVDDNPLNDGRIARITFTLKGDVPLGTVDNLTATIFDFPGGSVTPGSITVPAGPQPDWSSVPNSATGLNFGTLIADSGTSTLAITVTNIGEVDSNLTGTCTVGGLPYSMVVDSLGGGLAMNASSDISVQFDTAGLSPGTYNETMTCTHNGSAAAGETSPTAYPLTVFVRGNQTITGFAANPDPGTVFGSSTLSATASSGLTVTEFGVDASSAGICSVANNTVTYLAAGNCRVTADQAGNANYLPAPTAFLDITVNKADQAITNLAANPATGKVDGSSALSSTAGASTSPVVYGSTTPNICSVTGDAVTYLLVGTCTVTANQAEDDNYNAAPQVTLDITVEKGDQVITNFAADPSDGSVDETSALSATGGNSSQPVVFASATLTKCTVSGSTVTLLASGTCTVTANQAGDDNYNAAAEVTLDIGIDKTDQTISGFAATPNGGQIGDDSTLSATASSGLDVEFGSNTLSICTVTGSTVSYVAAGTCTVTANQAGNDDYNAAPEVTLDITVDKLDQAITNLAADPVSGNVEGTSALSANAGDSEAPVVFSSNTLSICTVSGSTVTYEAVGTCTVAANQAGDDEYNAAPEVTLDISVGKGDQTISGLAASPSSGSAGGSSSLSATASSGLTVTFSSDSPLICTVSGSTVSYIAVGTCIVEADQAGDDNYNAAPTVATKIEVSTGSQTISNFFSDPEEGFVDDTGQLFATGGGSTSPVVFGSDTPNVCTVSGNTVSFFEEGTCVVTANQAGDDNYSAAPEVTLEIEVVENELVAVPTLSSWSLITMLLLMLSIGAMVIRRNTF